MNHARTRTKAAFPGVVVASLALAGCLLLLLLRGVSFAADHNDPIAINSIFSDVPVDAADLYDMFGFPSDDKAGGEKVVVALTFASVPATGVFDPDMLYVIKLDPDPRVERPAKGEHSLEAFLDYAKQVEDRFVNLKASEVRVAVGQDGRATLHFAGFPSTGPFTQVVDTNKVVTVNTPDGGHAIKAYVGGRDDAFFNDLTGFFRSINYAPQFYNVERGAPKEMREIKIPKTLLELEGNRWFNADAIRTKDGPDKGVDPGQRDPATGRTLKLPLPKEPMTWEGNQFFKDADGDYRFVYTGTDAQSGINVNAIVLEIPLAFLTKSPQTDRVVNTWGESWVRKASGKIATIPDDPPTRPWYKRNPWLLPGLVAAVGALLLVSGILAARRRRAAAAAAAAAGQPRPAVKQSLWTRLSLRIAAGAVLIVLGLVAGLVWARVVRGQGRTLREAAASEPQMKDYKLIDTDGVPFSDAALSERLDENQLGANNIEKSRGFVIRTAHLGWGFGPSITALGLQTSFDHGGSPVSVHKEPAAAIEAFPRVKKVLFQELRMPDDSWNPGGKPIPLKRGVDIFIPNVCAIDMDTTGTWPFGRRLEDQVATRFLSIFLDMEATTPHGKKYNVETLGDPSLWDLPQVKIKARTPPNPLKNDKEFLKEFPYLADPWPTGGEGPAPAPAQP